MWLQMGVRVEICTFSPFKFHFPFLRLVRIGTLIMMFKGMLFFNASALFFGDLPALKHFIAMVLNVPKVVQSRYKGG